jgi:hypothetical protein
MRIKSIIGEVNVERQKLLRGYVGSVTVKIVMMKDSDREQSFFLERPLYRERLRRRQDVTAKLVWETVAEMLADRDDLEGMTLRGVEVVQENKIWSTPFEEMYPKTEDGS